MAPVRRFLLVTLGTLATSMLVAPAAFAAGGEGWLGETNDSTVTEAGFILIIFFPVFIGFASLLQAHLEKRKHARDDARLARERSSEWRGGW
jgi:peptidoglycan biosynthesis protein MviN/MurJ (putative lipid II flippase)